MPYCQNCGAEAGKDEKFCAECGAKIQRQATKVAAAKVPSCQNCGARIESGEKFCSECGTKIYQQTKKAAAAKVKVSAHDAKARGEAIDNCGDGIVFAEPTGAAPKETLDAKPKTAFRAGKKSIMLVAGTIIVIAVVAGAYMLMGGVPAGVPIYPDATESTIMGMTVDDILAEVGQTMPSGWSGKIYQTTATAGALTNWYRNNMPGWTKAYDELMSEEELGFSMDVLGFTRGDDGAFILSMSVFEAHYFFILEGPAEDMQDIISFGV